MTSLLSHYCLLFRLRCQKTVIKEVQRYKYEEEMSGNSIETVKHVLCECTTLNNQWCSRGDEYSNSLQTTEKVISRVKEFIDLVEDQEEEKEEWQKIVKKGKMNDERTSQLLFLAVFTVYQRILMCSVVQVLCRPKLWKALPVGLQEDTRTYEFKRSIRENPPILSTK